MFQRCIWAVFLGLACAYAPLAAAQPKLGDMPPAETRTSPFFGDVPACDDSMILAQIQYDFWNRERDYWDSDLAVESFDTVNETGFRTHGLSFVPRRYCRAQALFNDGQRRAVVYNVAEQTGFIGFGPGVTWCVVGLDRNHAFAPDCKAAGP